MFRPLFFLPIFLVFLGCSTATRRAPASIEKLALPGSCASRIRVFFAPKHHLVKNLDDFLRHTSLHVQRNKAMAIELISRFPKKFDLLNEELVLAFLKIHDQSKLNPALTQKGRRFIGERLYEFYGLPDGLLSEAEKIERKKLIAELNFVDSNEVLEFFRKNYLLDSNNQPNREALQLLEVEKIVDFVDRGSSPVTTEEFSRKVAKGSVFIDERLARYARYLERNYKRITKGLEY